MILIIYLFAYLKVCFFSETNLPSFVEWSLCWTAKSSTVRYFSSALQASRLLIAVMVTANIVRRAAFVTPTSRESQMLPATLEKSRRRCECRIVRRELRRVVPERATGRSWRIVLNGGNNARFGSIHRTCPGCFQYGYGNRSESGRPAGDKPGSFVAGYDD